MSTIWTVAALPLIYDDTAVEKPEDAPALTMEAVAAAVERLKGMGCLASGTMASWSSPWRASPFVFETDYLPATAPRKLTRWERFRVWVEDLADRADVYYYHPRVRRTEPAKAYRIGRDIYIPRAAALVVADPGQLEAAGFREVKP